MVCDGWMECEWSGDRLGGKEERVPLGKFPRKYSRVSGVLGECPAPPPSIVGVIPARRVGLFVQDHIPNSPINS